MSVKRFVHASGLRIVTEEVPSVRSAAVGIWVNVGSRDETPAVAGASHFLEHLLFKGTARRSALEISSSIEAVGGEMNAFTSKEYTCFYARVIDTDLPMAIDVVSDLITSSIVSALDVDAERKVGEQRAAGQERCAAKLVHHADRLHLAGSEREDRCRHAQQAGDQPDFEVVHRGAGTAAGGVERGGAIGAGRGGDGAAVQAERGGDAGDRAQPDAGGQRGVAVVQRIAGRGAADDRSNRPDQGERLTHHAHVAHQAAGCGGNLHCGLGGAGQAENGGGTDDDLPVHRAFFPIVPLAGSTRNRMLVTDVDGGCWKISGLK